MAEYDNRIPDKWQMLRIGMGGAEDLSVFAYYPSSQQTNFAVPSFCLAPADDEPEFMDVLGTIEQTMHDLLDYGASADDIRQIMGLVPQDELDETSIEYGEYTTVDLGYCIEGSLLGFEKMDSEACDVHTVFSDEQIARIEELFDEIPSADCLTAAQDFYVKSQALKSQEKQSASLSLADRANGAKEVSEGLSQDTPERNFGEMDR